MKVEELAVGDIVVNVDARGASYYQILKVNRVTVRVRSENGIEMQVYPIIFDRKIDYPVKAFPKDGAN